MKLAISLLAFVLIFGIAVAQTTEEPPAEEGTEGLESEITHNNNSDSVVVRNEDGEVVFSSVVFLDLGIEVDKPADRNVCLVRQTASNATCFMETPMTEPLPDAVREACEGREIAMLEPIDCDGDNNGGNADNAPSRKRRQSFSTCCRYTCWWEKHCVSTYCCKKFLGICTKRCCSTYDNRRVCSKKCVYGALSQY